MGKLLLCACLTCLASVSLQAQTRISGSVLDGNGEAVPGAAVMVEGMPGAGAATNLDGSYSFEVRLTAEKHITLVASAVGYESQRRRIREPQGSYEEDFVLRESQELLETVVVTATRTPKPLKDVPIITRVISAEEIASITGLSIEETRHL